MSDEQLHAIEVSIYHDIMVQVEGLEGELISQMCRCTGSQSWRGGNRLNDWVWVKQHPGRCHGELNRHLPLPLQRLFNIKLLNEDGAFVEYWIPLALTRTPENSGNLDPVTHLLQVRKSPAAVAVQVFSVGNILGCTHVIPEIATRGETGDRRNERWIVNCHIDLATWNDVYNLSRENGISHAGRRNARRDCRSVTHSISMPMQARTQCTYSDICSQLATVPEFSFKSETDSARRNGETTMRGQYATRCVVSTPG